MNNTRNVAQDGEQYVDDEVLAASVVHQDTNGREEDGEDEGEDAPAGHDDGHGERERGGGREEREERRVSLWRQQRVDSRE